MRLSSQRVVQSELGAAQLGRAPSPRESEGVWGKKNILFEHFLDFLTRTPWGRGRRARRGPRQDALMGAQCSRAALCQGTPPFHSTQQIVFINVSPTADMCTRALSAGCTISKFSVQEPLASQRVRAAAWASARPMLTKVSALVKVACRTSPNQPGCKVSMEIILIKSS